MLKEIDRHIQEQRERNGEIIPFDQTARTGWKPLVNGALAASL